MSSIQYLALLRGINVGGNQLAFTYLMVAYFILPVVLVVRELDFWKQKMTSR